MIQITAPINPGDTGGAVVNSRGQLIGIIHSTYGRAPSMESLYVGPGAFSRRMAASTMAAESINFVMPIDTVKPIAAQLIRHGEVCRGWLGVGIQTITEDTPEDDRQGQDKGVVVVRVLADSPAEAAGILPDDVLIDYNGKKVESAGQLIQMVGNTAPDETVKIQAVRAGKATPFAVTIGKAPKAETSYQRMIGDLVPFFANGWLGVHAESVTKAHADALKIEHGALVVSVLPGSPAQEMGVLTGDVIVRLNNRDIHDAFGLRSAVLSRKPRDIADGVFELEIVRKGERISMSSEK
jgi:serine protease Do